MNEEFYIPTKWRKQDAKNKQSSVNDQDWDITKSELGDISINDVNTQLLEQHCEDSYKLYQQYIKNGVAREMARMLLPQNLYTEIYSNWDLNNLMKLFSLRLDEHAQLEIREYVKAIYNITKEIYPMTIKAYDRYKIKVIDLEENT
jgi:thymidylate synthase (FAD)